MIDHILLRRLNFSSSEECIMTTRSTRLATVCSAIFAGVFAHAALAGQTLYFNDYETSSTGLNSITPGFNGFSVNSTAGIGGSGALSVAGDGFTFEAFIDLPNAPVGANGVIHLSYDVKVNDDPQSEQRLYLVGAYGRSPYRSMFAVNNRVTNSTTDTTAFQVRNGVDGAVIGNMAGNLPDSTWFRNDVYIYTRPGTLPTQQFRGFSRTINSDLTAYRGGALFIGNPQAPDGTDYTDYSLRNLQFFNSINATGVAGGNTTLFDNLHVQSVNAADLTDVTRAAFAGVPNFRYEFDNTDGLLTVNAADAERYITGILRTVRGDTNLDWKVDFNDLLSLAQAYGGTGGWANGDFEGDANVGFNDLLSLAQNYGFGSALKLSFAADAELAGIGWAAALVPEPTSLGLVGLSAMLLRRRR
jgi:hypothetical protein